MDSFGSSGYCWGKRTIKGTPPAPRQGHSLAVVGKTIYIFGGSSGNAYEHEDEGNNTPVFYNDLFTLKLIGERVSWERVKQTGDIPCPRDGHSLCCVGTSLYLFGGTDNPEGLMALDGLYCFNTGSKKWEACQVQGVQPKTLGHSVATIENSVYVFGGIYQGVAKNSIFMLNTDNLTWTPLLTSGHPPAPRCDHGCAVVGEKFYVMGGTGGENLWFNDMHCFDTAILQWRKVSTDGVPPHPRCFHTFTAHHQKDIYLFGGCNDSLEKKSVFSDLYKFNIASSKWKRPKASGIPPEKRFGHSACIIYGQVILFGGMNNQNDFNDICILQTRAANKYLYRDIAGLPVNSTLAATGFSSTKGPDLSFDLEHSLSATYKSVLPGRPTPSTTLDLGDLQQDVSGKLEEIFKYIKIEFEQLEMERETLTNAVEAFKEERKLHMEQYDNQQKELQDMFEKHKVQTEEWIKSEREQIDEEKRKLAVGKMQLVEQREKLFKEQELLEENSKRLEAIRKIGSIISEVDRTNGV